MNPNEPTIAPTDEAISDAANKPRRKSHLPHLSARRVVIFGLILIALIGGIILLTKHRTNPAVAPTGGNVSITPTGFFPQEIHIKKGQTLTWTNSDASKAHEVKADPYPTGDSLPNLDSGPLNNTDSYTYTFEKPGTYTYHDQQDPFKLKGTVVVQ